MIKSSNNNSQSQNTTGTLSLPKYLSIRIGPHTILPVYVYDYRYCRWQDHMRRNKKRAKPPTTKAEDSQDSQSSASTGNTAPRPIYRQWYTNDHEQELFRVLKPFLKSCIFSLNSPIVISSSVSTNKSSNSSKKGAAGKKKSPAASSKQRGASASSGAELDVRDALAQVISTDRNMQLVRGDNIQFSYQFSNTISKYWLMVPNPSYRRKLPSSAPIVIDSSDDGGDKKSGDANEKPEETQQEHSLKLDSSSDEESKNNKWNSHQLESKRSKTTKKQPSNSPRVSKRPSRSTGKRTRQSSPVSESSDSSSGDDYTAETETEAITETAIEVTATEEENDDVIVTKVVNADEYADRFLGYVPWRYSLIIYLEPHGSSDDDSDNIFSQGYLHNPELISYYMKK